MLPILQIGPLAVQTPGLVLLAGIWIGLSLAERRAHRYKISPDNLYNLAFVGLVTGILGARLIYAFRFWQAFAASPQSLYSINPGLLDPVGGLILAAVGAAAYGQRKHMPAWETLDALTPALAVLALSLGAARLASGEGYGAPTTVPWAVELWGAARHPTQLYEIFASGAILAYLLQKRLPAFASVPGGTFLLFLILQSTSRLFIDGFRADSPVLVLGLRTTQIVAWILLAISLLVVNARAAQPGRSQPHGKENDSG